LIYGGVVVFGYCGRFCVDVCLWVMADFVWLKSVMCFWLDFVMFFMVLWCFVVDLVLVLVVWFFVGFWIWLWVCDYCYYLCFFFL